MQNNGENRIHYRIKSRQSAKPKRIACNLTYALTALSASAVTAAAIAVCSGGGKKTSRFKKHYFTKEL